MNTTLLQIKVKLRLNKLASGDYDNIEAWQIIEAFNKVQLAWVRDQLHGNNATREGDEQSRQRVDDLQALLVTASLPGTHNALFYESQPLPADYLAFKRVRAQGRHLRCPDSRTFRVDLAEEGNAEDYLRDTNTTPDWDWGETFCTLAGNKVRIYTLNRFAIEQAALTYYRKPAPIMIPGVVDPSTGIVSVKEVPCEFKEDIAELLTDLTASQLAGDMELFAQQARTKGQADANN